jgi:Tfp pilus assembly protein PilN
MINLLPNGTKQQIRAARTNAILLNYIIFLGLAIIFLALACAATYLILTNEKNSATNQPKTTQSSQTDNQSTAKDILDQQISYSNIITGIAAALPSGVILDKLSLSNNSFNMPLTLQFYARSTDDAAKLKDNFKSTLFSNPSIQSTLTDSNGPSGYPNKITISVTINKGAAQ